MPGRCKPRSALVRAEIAADDRIRLRVVELLPEIDHQVSLRLLGPLVHAPVGAVSERHGGTVDPVILAVARPAVIPEVGGRQPKRP